MSLRFVAVLIDVVVLVVVIVVIGLATGGAYSTTDNNGIHQVGVAAGGWWPFLVFFGYYVVFEAVSGRTIGKRLVGLRVVDKDGDSISWGQALGRNLLRVVDAFLFYFVAAIFVWSSSRRQRLGDRAANTFVIHDGGKHWERAQPAPMAVEQPHHAAAADNTAYYTHEQFMDDIARAKQVSD